MTGRDGFTVTRDYTANGGTGITFDWPTDPLAVSYTISRTSLSSHALSAFTVPASANGFWDARRVELLS